MNVLFVCTGNIFRSMSAEYLLRKYLQDNKIQGVVSASAGTIAEFQSPYEETVNRLNFYGCDPTPHKQRKISKEILQEQDYIVCMAEYHRSAVRELGYDAVLFNEIAYEKTEDVLDDGDFEKKYGRFPDIEEYVPQIVDYLHDAMPYVVNNICKK